MGTVEGIRVSVELSRAKPIIDKSISSPSREKVQQLLSVTFIVKCSESAVERAVASLMAGNLVAFPTETVYGLGADACNPDAVRRIYDVKDRPVDHPVIVHISSIKQLDKWAKDIPEYAKNLSRSFWPGPMTLILPRADLAKDFVTGYQNNVGLRVPAHPVALSLLSKFEAQGGYGVAAPSANKFGKVSATLAADVESELFFNLNSGDLILDDGLSPIGIESTIIDCTNAEPRILRPGAITTEMLSSFFNSAIKSSNSSFEIKVPGSMESHYSPRAKIYLDGSPALGDGFFALRSIPTPKGTIRLSSPINNEEFARVLYYSMHLADNLHLSRVYIVPPSGDGLATAILDRLIRAAKK
jgi:L-threonylcarbamoyladenylate synthase